MRVRDELGVRYLRCDPVNVVLPFRTRAEEGNTFEVGPPDECHHPLLHTSWSSSALPVTWHPFGFGNVVTVAREASALTMRARGLHGGVAPFAGG
jgi:hypothetical protein